MFLYIFFGTFWFGLVCVPSQKLLLFGGHGVETLIKRLVFLLENSAKMTKSLLAFHNIGHLRSLAKTMSLISAFAIAQARWRLKGPFVSVCTKHRALVRRSHILHPPGPFSTFKVHRDKM